MAASAADLALELADIVGELAAVVHWCVEHEGECLGDNPRQFALARRALASAHARMLKRES